MAQNIITDYTLNKAGGTLTLNGIATVRVESLIRVFNITRNVMVHELAAKNTILQAVGSVFTLSAAALDSISADTDVLHIVYDGSIQTVDAAYEPTGGKLLVGTAREKFFDNFREFDTSPTGNWQVVQTGDGMAITGPFGGGVAGATPYINISSGTTSGAMTVILSRASFLPPTELRYQISASQRIANNAFRIGFVEVDDAGALVVDTTYAAAPGVLNARNAVFQEMSGTTATTGTLLVRAAAAAQDSFTTAFGVGSTTAATGSTPNFIVAATYGLMFERDRINARSWGQNLIANTGGQFAYDRTLPNPTRKYKLCILVENTGVPASSTDWRIHLVNVLDAVRFDVSPRAAGTNDLSKAFPVNLAGGTLGTLTTLTTAGTPAVPATPYFVNSAASTNGALILTGTSGLSALWATNTGAGAAFVKLYNKATAPTVGTDVPEMIIPVPAALAGVPGTATLPMGFNGFRFPLGLGIAITGAVADTDTTAVAAGQVKVKLSRTV
jgi:hypothetical protein